MSRLRLLLPVACAAGCQTYTPLSLDLEAHAAAFAARHEAQPPRAGFDLADGITRAEGRALALVFEPGCRLARLRAGVAAAGAAHAGAFDDPVLSADVTRILESVAHPWLVGGALELTLPLFGRRAREIDLADDHAMAALVAARIAEQETVLALDRAWAAFSAAQRRVEAGAEMLRRVEGLEAIAARLAAAGELTRTEARVFTLERTARADAVEAARTDAALAELAVTRLCGLAPGAPVTLVPDLGLLPPDGAERSVERFVKGPRGMRFAADYMITEDRLALEIARQWPDLTLAPGWEEEDAQPRVRLGLSLPLPLWNRNARAIAEASAEREVSAEALRAALEQWLCDCAVADRRHAAAVARRARLERDLLPLADQQLEDSRTLAERGTLDPLLLLDSLSRAHDARLAVIDATLEQALRAADLCALDWISAPDETEAVR